MIPWEMGKQLLWDVTVVDALAPIRLNQGPLCNPGPTATDAEGGKIEKHRKLLHNGDTFQPVALEVQGLLGESSEIFITRFCKILSCARRSTSWQFFKATDFNGSSERERERRLITIPYKKKQLIWYSRRKK